MLLSGKELTGQTFDTKIHFFLNVMINKYCSSEHMKIFWQAQNALKTTRSTYILTAVIT